MSSPGADDWRPARGPVRPAAATSCRRLSAILHADLSGYVRLMEGAEDRTVSRLKSVRAEIWQPAVDAAGGRIVNIVADSVLAEFSSAVAAVAAAIGIQEQMARFNDGLGEEQQLRFRIGLHLGEVIVDETQTIFGDAVNVAARIQLLAEPGGIAASRALRDATHLQVDHAFVDGGRHHAKNVSRSLQIFHLRPRESASSTWARVVSRIRTTGVPIRRPVLCGSVTAAVLLLAGGGYLALTTSQVTSVGMAALNLSTEQLEQALAERRKADALAAEKRQLEEQARYRAETEAAAKRQADADLESARKARQKAERELAQVKADIEARRKAEGRHGDRATVAAQRAAEEAAQREAEAEAASLRKAEEETAKKAAANAAAKSQADQALAGATGRRKRAEADALAAASKAAAALPGFAEDAEAEEKRLRLGPADRQRLQLALTSLGFDTRGDDAVFGPRSREMIAHWQRARNQPTTGFMTRAQQQALLKEAEATLASYDEQRKAAAELKGRAPLEMYVTAAPPSSAPADGLWRGTFECGRNAIPFTLKPELHLKGGTATWYTASPSSKNGSTLGIGISIEGTNVLVKHLRVVGGVSTTPLSGRLEGNSVLASNNDCTMMLVRVASTADPPPAPPTAFVNATYGATYSGAASPALPSPDGSWRGTYRCNASLQMGSPFVIDLKLHLTNGSATWRSVGPGSSNGNSFDVAVSVVRDISSVARTAVGRSEGVASFRGARGEALTGQYDGVTINATGRERSSGRDCTLALTRS